MSFFTATLGQLILTEAFVLFIWTKVLLAAVRHREPDIDHKRMLITSLGLVLNAIAIVGIIAFRIVEYMNNTWPFVPGVIAFYVMLGIGNFLFIVVAAIGGNTQFIKFFIGATLAWTIICAYFGAFKEGVF